MGGIANTLSSVDAEQVFSGCSSMQLLHKSFNKHPLSCCGLSSVIVHIPPFVCDYSSAQFVETLMVLVFFYVEVDSKTFSCYFRFTCLFFGDPCVYLTISFFCFLFIVHLISCLTSTMIKLIV